MSPTQRTTGRSEDERFKLLSNARRRHVLYALSRADAPVDVEELSRLVLVGERDARPDGDDGDDLRRVHDSLVGTHLPRLAGDGLVAYDGRTASLPAEVRRRGVLGVVPPARPWGRYYALLAGAVWAIVLAAASNLGPLAAVSWRAVAAVAGAAAIAATLAQYATDRRARATPAVAFESLVE